jgi:hypothetical protein
LAHHVAKLGASIGPDFRRNQAMQIDWHVLNNP